MRKRILTIILSVFLLFGCATQPVVVAAPKVPKIIDQTQKIYHPPLPAPITTFACASQGTCWKVININGVPYKAISHNDSIDFTIWMRQKEAYDKKVKETLCFYRKDLKEKFCNE